MTPERWKQVEQIYYSTLQRGDSERNSFFKEASAGDEVFRNEVESPVAHKERVESLIAVLELRGGT